MKKLILIIVLLSPLSWVNPSLAADLEVCESGCAYSSIQEAIDVAGDGDTIKVAAGTYYESDITIDNSITLTIRGGYDAANFSNPPSTDPAATVVDALGLGRGFHIYAYNGETINVIIEGLTIVNGFTSGYGGGIYVEVTTYSSSLSDTTVKLDVRRVIINGNSAGYNGAGVYAYPYTGNDTFVSIFEITLSDSRIVGNTACDDGGGVYIRGYSSSSYAGMSEVRFSIEGNRINGNSATGYGGGMYIELDNCRYAGVIPGPVAKRAPVPGPSITSNEICRNSSASDITGLYIELEECTSTSEIDIINNVITGNWDYSGNRAPALYIYSEETSPEFNLFNNTVFGNYGYGFEAYSAGSGGVTDNFTLNLRNNIISGNLPGDQAYFYNYSDGNLVTNSGNNLLGGIDVNNTAYNNLGFNLTGDPLLGDDLYPTASSPAVNAADDTFAPATDKDGNSRVGDPDIGALEYQGTEQQASMPAPDQLVTGSYPPTEKPIVTSDPFSAIPVAVGDVEGGILDLAVKTSRFAPGAVDMYLWLHLPPSCAPLSLIQIAPGGAISTLAESGLVKWKSGVTSAVNEVVYSGIPLSTLPKGKYRLYLIVTPQDVPGLIMYKYETYFIVQ